MRYFFLLETLPLSIDLANNFVHVGFDIKLGISKDCKNQFVIINNWLWMIYPIVQALGMLFFKQSKDPLQSISSLDLIIIMSKRQRCLTSFKRRMANTDDFGSLNEDQKKDMFRKFDKREEKKNTPTQKIRKVTIDIF